MNHSLILDAGTPSSSPDTAIALAVSVVIPTRGRVECLRQCLEALCAQTLTRELFEVVVCDDGSPRPIEPSISDFAERLTLTVVRQAHAGPAAARNEGARHAAARYIAFTDDDCAPAPDWLAKLLERFERQPDQLIGGAIANLLPDDPYATGTQLIMDCVFDEDAREGSGYQFYSTTNLALPADRFWEIGGFSESFPRAAGEDYDLCARWRHAGLPSAYAPEAVVGHAHGHHIGTYLKQHYNYGRGLLRVRRRAARRAGRRGVSIEQPGFYARLIGYPLRERDWPLIRRLQYAALIALAQLATAIGAVVEAIVHREPSEPNANGDRADRTRIPPSR